MAAARYWRIVGVRTWGDGALSLSELRLYSAASDVSATLVCTHPPASGALADLSDDTLASACEFAREAYASAGFAFTFDCGTDVAVSAFGFGTGAERAQALCSGTLQYLSAGAWVTRASFGAFPWPGAFSLSGNPSGGDEYLSYVTALLPLQADFSATIGGTWTVNGSVGIDSTPRFVGVPSAQFSGGYLTSAYRTDTDLSSGDWTVELWMQFNSVVPCIMFNTGAGTSFWTVQIYFNGTNFGLRGFPAGGGGEAFHILGGTASTGVQYFITARRAGAAIGLYVNGTLVGSATFAGGLFTPPVGPTIGGYSSGVYTVPGWIGQVRITKGVARDAVVPAEPFLASAGGGVTFVPLPISYLWAPANTAASAVTAAHSAAGVSDAATACDTEFGGPGAIYGTTKSKADPANIPLKARVRLLRQRDALLVRETWSDPVTGEWAVTGIDTRQPMIALAQDADGVYQAVAADRLVPEVAP